MDFKTPQSKQRYHMIFHFEYFSWLREDEVDPPTMDEIDYLYRHWGDEIKAMKLTLDEWRE